MIKNRSIAVCIILTIVTCGIYGLYWLYTLAEDTNIAAGEKNGTSGGMVVLLSIVTCGIYNLYFMYKQGEKLETAKRARDMSANNNGILYLVLALFGFAIISYAIMQDDLNKIAGNPTTLV